MASAGSSRYKKKGPARARNLAAATPLAASAAAAAAPGAGARRAVISPSRHRPRHLSTDLLERFQFARSVDDITFDGKRDLYLALGYAKRITLRDYRMRYERGGIAERIVDALPNATWSGGADIVENPDPETLTPFEEAVNDLFQRLDVWGVFTRADILAGIGRYAVILVGVPGDPSTPFPALSSPDDVFRLTALGEGDAQMDQIVRDKTNPRYSLPEFYNCKLGSGLTATYHWSRIIHIADGALENPLFGRPRLRAVWNYLDDLTKLVGGGGEASWRRMDPGLHVDIDPEVEISEDEQAAMEEQLDEYVHEMRRIIQTRGTKVTPLPASVTRFSENATLVMRLISGVTTIPQRILMGSERGELASIQDRNNWNDRITERRKIFAIRMVRAFIDTLILKGALPKPSKYALNWPEVEELSEDEKGTLSERCARANHANSRAGGGLVFTADEIRDRVWGMPSIKDGGVPVLPEKKSEGEGEDGGGTTSGSENGGDQLGRDRPSSTEIE